MMCRLSALTLGACLLAATALAADHPIAGDRLVLKDPAGKPERRALRLRALSDSAIDPATAADPRTAGATLEVVGSGTGDGTSGALTLAPRLWRGLGKPSGSKGYRFLDRNQSAGVKQVLFKPGRKGGALVVSGGKEAWPYQITQAQSSIDVRFSVGGDVYCAQFVSFDSNAPGKVQARNAAPPADCAAPVCGDGVAGGNEECDDGNTTPGDGCSATCQLESASAVCAGVPTVAGTALASVRVVSGLQRPVYLTAPPLDTNRLFVVEQEGRIRIVKNGVLLPTAFLAIESRVTCCGEQGLLSMAFHSNYEVNGRFFVSYTAPGGGPAGKSVVSEFQVMAGNPDRADATETVLLEVDQPFSNHNGGLITFGPGGFLYLGLGDGGFRGDPLGAGQDDGTALGKLLRIDVDAPPASPVDAIWAKGVRNPWRYSFDRATGDLYVADVGQSDWEEINVVAAPVASGVNYGWNIREGRHCYPPGTPTCSTVGLTEPVLEYGHGEGCSVTGGYVYRGCRMPDLSGTYFYSDYCTPFIRTFAGVSGGNAQNLADRTGDLDPPGGPSIDTVTSFGEDARGELYVVDYGSGGADGEVFRIVPGS